MNRYANCEIFKTVLLFFIQVQDTKYCIEELWRKLQRVGESNTQVLRNCVLYMFMSRF